MSYADTFELPVTREVNGMSYRLPLLTTRDYDDWVDELTTAARKAHVDAIPENTKPKDRAIMQREASAIDCTPDQVRLILSTPRATRRVLEIAGRKAGVDKDNLAAFVDAGSARQNERDAYHASGLYTRTELHRMFPDEAPVLVVELITLADKGDAAGLAAAAERFVAGRRDLVRQRREAAERAEAEAERPNDDAPNAGA